jgi:DNA-binding MarR family transcriptional regulator
VDNIEILIAENSSVYSRHLIGKARHLMFLARQRELTPYNILPTEAYILFLLYNLGHKATLAELSKHTIRKMGTLSVQMTRMEKEGLVKKSRDNSRSVLLKYELTEKGIDAYKISNKMESEKEIMSILSEEERQQFITILQKVISKAEIYNEAKP